MSAGWQIALGVVGAVNGFWLLVWAVAWVQLRREDRARRVVSEREREVADLEVELHLDDPEPAPEDLGIALTREQYRRDCLAYHLRQPVTPREAARS